MNLKLNLMLLWFVSGELILRPQYHKSEILCLLHHLPAKYPLTASASLLSLFSPKSKIIHMPHVLYLVNIQISLHVWYHSKGLCVIGKMVSIMVKWSHCSHLFYEYKTLQNFYKTLVEFCSAEEGVCVPLRVFGNVDLSPARCDPGARKGIIDFINWFEDVFVIWVYKGNDKTILCDSVARKPIACRVSLHSMLCVF